MKIARSLLLGAAASAIMATGAQAADLIVTPPPALDPIYTSPMFNFEGLYVGVTGGATQADGLRGNVGVVAGVNFALADAFIAGLEFQGDLYYNGFGGGGLLGSGAASALVLGRVGAVVTEEVLVYAAAGVGTAGGPAIDAAFPGTGNEGFWAAGGGVELAVTDNLAIRGEGLYLRSFNDLTATGAPGDAGKFTVGLIWHLD